MKVGKNLFQNSKLFLFGANLPYTMDEKIDGIHKNRCSSRLAPQKKIFFSNFFFPFFFFWNVEKAL
jgi:hypothetical protein